MESGSFEPPIEGLESLFSALFRPRELNYIWELIFQMPNFFSKMHEYFEQLNSMINYDFLIFFQRNFKSIKFFENFEKKKLMIFQGNEAKFNNNGFFKANPIVNPIYFKVLKQTNLDFLTSLKKNKNFLQNCFFQFLLKIFEKNY